MKVDFIIIKIILFLFIVVGMACKHSKPPIHDLPPGYKMMTNFDSTKFVALMPGGTKLGTYDYPEKAFMSYQDAVDRAWEMYNFMYEFKHKTSELDTIKWYDAEENKN